ncbi:response regulator [Belnapia sp. T6]|uniref:Response regulator n=1 Tax=Belnapia mucosa TaxID=2804532 RepID=A0ABS1VCJ9_9PROT|nr:response regulator [Belnapia mucosa]MBL6458464.1 response regulator [Belnapia mucosa]
MLRLLPDEPSVQLGACRVLVVEDEVLLAMLLEDALEEAGATVIGPVGSVDRALDLIERSLADGGIDACALDMNLGGASALPVADALHRHGVPFFFMTGYGDTDGQGEHVRRPTLHKPFKPHDLLLLLLRLAGDRSLGGGGPGMAMQS